MAKSMCPTCKNGLRIKRPWHRLCPANTSQRDGSDLTVHDYSPGLFSMGAADSLPVVKAEGRAKMLAPSPV